MFDALRRALQRRAPTAATPVADAPPPPTGPPVDDLHLAACALLLEVAHIDGEFDPAERQRLEHALAHHFGLDDAGIAALIAAADTDRRESVDHFQYTRRLVEGYDLGQKMLLAEVMWQIILADGHASDHETWLARKLARLLELEPAYLSEARRKAGGSAAP